MISKIVKKVRVYIWKKNRNKLDGLERKRLTEKAQQTSIISMNCTGGGNFS